jgi:(p)ppGpp synthase/HD superfamily hydrolase
VDVAYHVHIVVGNQKIRYHTTAEEIAPPLRILKGLAAVQNSTTVDFAYHVQTVVGNQNIRYHTTAEDTAPPLRIS